MAYRPWADVTPERRRAMQSNTSRDTKPELVLRRELHARGLRYRVAHPIPLEGRRPVRPDVVFTRFQIAVFIDGWYWHGCPTHGTVPTTRRAYWQSKFLRNAERDRDVDRALQAAGWTVVRAWEHEAACEIAGRVELAIDRARRASQPAARLSHGSL
jgi:DNA mismatch endonuclease (patch repair protein)